MLFNSMQFIIFFPIVVVVYFALPYRFRWFMLLMASYYFYMCWKVEYILLIIISTLIDYYAGIHMGNTDSKRKRRKFLLLSLLANLGLLFSFKYFNFVNDSLRAAFNSFNIFYNVPAFNVFLPVGISFYTFQTLSYSIDVYRGERKPEKHFGIFALYVAFFPQLVAGPIERSTRLLPQFFEKHDFDPQRVANGLKLMLWGFFKKIIIADRLAVFVDQVYNNPADYQGWPVILATYFFAFQIYCDFSGYSDIAIGAAQIMGFRLMNNFNRPYFATSVSEFWKRWHISLSTWFRDYLYISLGGNRVVKWRWYYNLFVVFLISGLWHGANWTFLVWGAIHGFFLVFSIWTHDIRQKIAHFSQLEKFPHVQKAFKVFMTFHLVLFSWIFFRANSISEAFLLIRNMLGVSGTMAQIFELNYTIEGINLVNWELLLALTFILVMESVHVLQRGRTLRQFLSERPVWMRWAVYYAMVFAILMFGVFEKNAFIYFQF